MSKKDALILGVLAIGGIGAASMISDTDTTGDSGAAQGGRAGGILGSQQGYGSTDMAPTVYNLPGQPAVTFPDAPTFDMSKILSPAPISRGTAGVSSAGKKRAVTPYLYTGGEVKAGAVSVAPWAMGKSTAAEIGVTTALGMAKKGGFMGTGMTQDAYKSQTAHRTYSSPTTAKKTPSDASKAISHAKRLRAGRGD